MSSSSFYVHETAIIETGASIGHGSKIWHFCHVRSGSKISSNVSLARDVYIDVGVQIGESSRVQNGVSIYQGVKVGNFCFVGPHVIFTNDMVPRVGVKNWTIVETELQDGCSIGAGAIIRCGISIGAYAMVGTGSLVLSDVLPFQVVHGAPAKAQAQICACGKTQAPLGTPFEVIRKCCEENMQPQALAVAKSRA